MVFQWLLIISVRKAFHKISSFSAYLLLSPLFGVSIGMNKPAVVFGFNENLHDAPISFQDLEAI